MIFKADARVLDFQRTMLECYDTACGIWSEITLKKWSKELLKLLEEQDWTQAATFQRLWESVSLDTHAGDQNDAKERSGNVVLPTHASEFLFKHLMELSKRFNTVIGFGLEFVCIVLSNMIKRNACFFIESLCQNVVDTYAQFVSSTIDSKVSEKGALQLFFDFRYMVKVIEGGWSSNPGKGQQAKGVLDQIKGKIDPIDLAVADMTLASNVERHYVRTIVTLGAFLALNPKPIELYVDIV